MDNKTKHENLEQSEIRDFLAKQVGYGYDGEVENVKAQIKKLEGDLEKAKASQAARDLIKINGWKEHDVSDDVDTYVSGEYFPFIGTDKELENKTN
tara:strand:- start:475 stop:762 length:288 start_codon:yes stop_codon:yes gene_type:complete